MNPKLSLSIPADNYHILHWILSRAEYLTICKIVETDNDRTWMILISNSYLNIINQLSKTWKSKKLSWFDKNVKHNSVKPVVAGEEEVDIIWYQKKRLS